MEESGKKAAKMKGNGEYNLSIPILIHVKVFSSRFSYHKDLSTAMEESGKKAAEMEGDGEHDLSIPILRPVPVTYPTLEKDSQLLAPALEAKHLKSLVFVLWALVYSSYLQEFREGVELNGIV